MSANVESMFSGSGIRPWHGIGTVIEGTASSEDAIRLAGLDWEVKQEPIFLQNGNQLNNLSVFANVRQDKGTAVGLTSDRYNIIQNKDVFQFADNIIKDASGGDARYETAGSLFDGRQIFILVRLPDKNLVGDQVENYMFITNTHDGTKPLMAGITNVRVVCNNTLQLAQQTAKRVWTVRHFSNWENRKHEAEVSLGFAMDYINNLEDVATKMAGQKVSEEKFFRQFFEKLGCSEKRREEITMEVGNLYSGKDDLQNFRGTAWGMYNAVADFVSNGKSKKTLGYEERKMANFMLGNDMLKVAQDILVAA